ncbi:MAG: 4Fe-4S binding protein [Candidatus Bilamarchaeaceae archaeon]
MAVIIRHEGCILCAGCAAVCPKRALELVGNKIAHYPEKCVACGACVKVCPSGVISLKR